MPKTLAEINAMPPERFVHCFGDVAEHAAWVAQAAARARPFASRDAMIAAFAEAVRDAEPERQLDLLRSHPDLAGKAARDGAITADSRRERHPLAGTCRIVLPDVCLELPDSDAFDAEGATLR
jgi:2-oxo-4-hydroxy-4-carboxy-5-ureidoimidazoline decarboxylase